MKIFTSEDISNIRKRYLAGQNISRSERLFFQTIDGTRKAGIKYLMSFEEMVEWSKCYNDIDYFINNYCKIRIEDGSIGKIQLRDYQKEILDLFKENKYSILFKSRQTGIGASLALSFLHHLLFNKNKKIVIISNKICTGNELIRKIKDAYKLLPFYLKQGLIKWNEREIIFENGSQIKSMARGFEYEDEDIVYIDEFAFIPTKILMPIFLSIFQNLKTDGKFIIGSGPNGFNLFYDLVEKSERPTGDPQKNIFKTKRVYWWQVPGRDQKWVNEQIKMIGGKKMFDRDYNLCFFGREDDVPYLNIEWIKNYISKNISNDPTS